MLPVSEGADLLGRVVAAPGLYRGRGDGPESGRFVGRMVVTPVLDGRAVTLDYEATSDRHGLQHVEHTLFVVGEDGGLELHVACLALPGVTRFRQADPGVFKAHEAPLTARIVLRVPGPGRLSYAWWWTRNEQEPREQSRCELRRG